jgi:hypothetical protein
MLRHESGQNRIEEDAAGLLELGSIPPSRVSSELRTSLATDAPESIALEVRAKRRSDEGDPVSKAGAVQKGRDRAKLEQASGVLFNPVLTGLVPQHSL